jgi:hypothetical protein
MVRLGLRQSRSHRLTPEFFIPGFCREPVGTNLYEQLLSQRLCAGYRVTHPYGSYSWVRHPDMNCFDSGCTKVRKSPGRMSERTMFPSTIRRPSPGRRHIT